MRQLLFFNIGAAIFFLIPAGFWHVSNFATSSHTTPYISQSESLRIENTKRHIATETNLEALKKEAVYLLEARSSERKVNEALQEQAFAMFLFTLYGAAGMFLLGAILVYWTLRENRAQR